MKPSCFTIFLTFCLSVTLHADLPAYEGFEFSGTITQRASGTRFLGEWILTSGEFATLRGSLRHPTLLTNGNRITSQVNGVNIAARRFSGAPDNGHFWASILIESRHGGGVTFSNNPTDNLNLVGRGFQERPRFGFGINGDQFVYTLDGRSEYPVFASVDGATAAPTLLVVHFDVTNGEFSMWANPTLGGAAPTGGILVADKVKFTRTGETFANDVTHAALSTNWADVQLDELRLGTSFRDVAPVQE